MFSPLLQLCLADLLEHCRGLAWRALCGLGILLWGNTRLSVLLTRSMKCMRSLKLSTMTTFNSIMSLAAKCIMATAIVFLVVLLLLLLFFLQEFACNCSKVAVKSVLQLVICVLVEILLVKWAIIFRRRFPLGRNDLTQTLTSLQKGL